MTESIELGTCCGCGTTENVHSVIALNKRSPYGGGWGCFQCGLPAEGAIAVMCDECIATEAPIREVVAGMVSQGQRVPYGAIDEWEDFQHDLKLHSEAASPPHLAENPSPNYLPPYWRNEATGVLQPAIEALIHHGANPKRFPPPTPEQMELIIQYFRLYINAPCWRGDDRLLALKKIAGTLQTPEDCDRWLLACLDLGLDPL